MPRPGNSLGSKLGHLFFPHLLEVTVLHCLLSNALRTVVSHISSGVSVLSGGREHPDSVVLSGLEARAFLLHFLLYAECFSDVYNGKPCAETLPYVTDVKIK